RLRFFLQPLSQIESPIDGPLIRDVERLSARVDFVISLRPMMDMVRPPPRRAHLAAVQTIFVGHVRRSLSVLATDLLHIAADVLVPDDVEPVFARGHLTPEGNTGNRSAAVGVDRPEDDICAPARHPQERLNAPCGADTEFRLIELDAVERAI